MGALMMSSCQLLVKMNSLKDSEDAKTMPTDTKGATDDTKTVFNDTEVANKAAMAGKLKVEHSEIVIKKDDVEHHSVTENAMIVSTKVTAKEMAKAAMAMVGHKMPDKVNAEPKERPCTHLWTDLMVTQTGGTNWADPGMDSPDKPATHEYKIL